MAFLLQCLRDVRTMTGQMDLLPPPERRGSLVMNEPPRPSDKPSDASSRSFAMNPFPFVALSGYESRK
jgi:hypothetical protein